MFCLNDRNVANTATFSLRPHRAFLWMQAPLISYEDNGDIELGRTFRIHLTLVTSKFLSRKTVIF